MSPVPQPLPDADVCVVAGDFGVGGVAPALGWLHEHVAPAMDVVFVAGNHDYYRTAYVDALREGREAASRLPHVHFLENDAVTIGCVTFVGCTLWTDFAITGSQELAIFDARTGMNDYKLIKFTKRPFVRFTPERTVRMHLYSRAYLEHALATAKGKTVVVTHHAPSRLSVSPRFADGRLSAAYASNLDDLMKDGPTLWIHGHVHQPVDYVVGLTRVLSNPIGYPGELEDRFRGSWMVVDI
ncbi:metallophosphoesterase [Ensifer sp. IC3342]|nr:metallophosphoesterase [Ensifer sp. BRP08]MCA1450913.1 metallophosphoesterase [Ensifer sp. IC3342]